MTDVVKIEYRVRPITRYVVTRFHQGENVGSCEEKGSFDNVDVAFEVAYALCKEEHERLGFPPGDHRMIYPVRPDELVQIKPFAAQRVSASS